MKLALLGATGGTGRHILDAAVARSHQVSVLARTPSKLGATSDTTRVVQGNALDPVAVGELVRGQDAVVSALGVTTRAPTTLYSDSARVVLEAMARHDVPHVVAITAGAIAHDRALPVMFRLVVQPILLRAFAGTYQDMMRLEELVRRSDRRWTLVRPSQLTNASAVGRYRVSEHALPRGWSVARADLADLVVQCVEDREQGNRALFVAY